MSQRVEPLGDDDDSESRGASVDNARLFTIPVDGDCQEPLYNHGEIVVFSFDAYEREGIIPGKSYYLAFIDGSTTFKRVFLDPSDPGVFILRCWNEKKYPREKRIHAGSVKCVARAISKHVSPED